MTAASDRRTLLVRLSDQRYCPSISFVHDMEAAITKLENAEPVSAVLRRPGIERHVRNAFRLTRRPEVARLSNRIEFPKEHFDLLVTTMMSFRELWMLGGQDLSRVAGKRICFITEIWPRDVRLFGAYRDVLKQFDAIFVMNSSVLEPLRAEVGPKVHWMPAGVDALMFLPEYGASRPTDVFSIGRRSTRHHAELLELVAQRRLTYMYDTMSGGRVENWREHRLLLAQQIAQSSFFIAHRAKFDQPDETTNAHDFGNRFADGAAAGAILIGDVPNTEEFRKEFNWEDAVFSYPADAPGFDAHIMSLLRQKERLEAASIRNVVESLRRNDWVYRWEVMLRAAGMQLKDRAVARKQVLSDAAGLYEQGKSFGPFLGRFDDAPKGIGKTIQYPRVSARTEWQADVLN